MLGTLEYFQIDPDDAVFQHDNDPKHTALGTKKWLSDHQINVLTWPPQSPDLNPIEHLWSELKRRIHQLGRKISNITELWDKVQDVWNEIPQDVIDGLYNTMTQRISDVIKAKGGFTRW